MVKEGWAMEEGKSQALWGNIKIQSCLCCNCLALVKIILSLQKWNQGSFFQKRSSWDKPDGFAFRTKQHVLSQFLKKCCFWFELGIVKSQAFSLEYSKTETFCSSLIADLLSCPLRWLIEKFETDKVKIWKPFSLPYSLHYSLFPVSRLIRNVLQRNE